jgi:hypothetical protein
MALPTTVTVTNPKNFKQVQNAVTRSTAGDTTIIAAQGASTKIRVKRVVVSVSTCDATSVIALEDGVGGSRLWQITCITDEDQNGTHVINFGEEGLALSSNTLLNLTIETAASTAHVTAIGYVTGVVNL